jgi:sporulation inhibitor KapD
MREIKGQLHHVSNDYRMISIQVVKKLEFFYLQPRFVKQFRQYLYPGVFVQFTADDEVFTFRRRNVSKVITFEKILGNRYHRKFSYFDQKIVKQKILKKINDYSYRLFLDLEMTMQHSKTQSEEIIQAGAILVDQNDRVLFTFDSFIKPTKIKEISKWTLDFLHVSEQEIMNGISYHDFYQVMKEIVEKYQPAIVVWGNNDNYALEQSYIINQVDPLFSKRNYINMQVVHKQFYNLNYELGLFQTAKIYTIDSGVQEHHAFVDAEITRQIFNQFYEYAIRNVTFDFKKRFLETK